MRRVPVFVLYLLLSLHSNGQPPVGSWSDRLRYNTALNVAAGSDRIFSSTGSSIIVYNKEYAELRKMSTITGLSETGISDIAWSEENNLLVIAYSNANVDLVRNDAVYNIPDIMNKYISGKKQINRIRTMGRYAYLASSFGIVVIDLIREEIYDTWRPGPDFEANEVFDLAFLGGQVYAATATGVWQGNLQDPGLAYSGNWDLYDNLPEPGSAITHILASGNKLYINVSPSVPNGDYVYVSGTPSALFAHSPGIVYTSFDYAPDGFTVSSPGELKHFSTDGSLKKSVSSYGWGSPAISQGITYNQDIWIADINYGLVKGDNQLRFELMNLQGPASNFVESITSLNGKTIICAGGIDKYGKGLKREYSVSVHENNKYTNLISEGLFDAILSCIDPDDPDHYFISTAGYGLLEYDKNVLVNHFGGNNLQPVSSAQGSGEMIISGMAFDKAGNLWITQTGSPGSIRVLTTEGKWITFPFTIESSVAGEIIVTRDGIKWIVLPGENGLFVLDDNKTPGAFGDDKSKKFMVRDPDGKIITRVTSLAEDFDGNIWVGTGQGPLIYYEPKKIIEDDPAAFRIKVPRNDGTGLADYMLSTETITAVVVDGANRKWLGTEGSGAYLLSADGTVMLKNYNKQNSPVFSDSIRSIAVDNKTGEVWLGTSAGVLSVREIATGGSQDYMKVYAFPNPVREDFTGNVTITGLIKDTQVWITDISGNLVNKTRSEGGQASWDLSTYSGRRVSTGVYLIFCATDDGSRSFVTKILVIR